MRLGPEVKTDWFKFQIACGVTQYPHGPTTTCAFAYLPDLYLPTDHIEIANCICKSLEGIRGTRAALVRCTTTLSRTAATQTVAITTTAHPRIDLIRQRQNGDLRTQQERKPEKGNQLRDTHLRPPFRVMQSNSRRITVWDLIPLEIPQEPVRCVH